MADLYHNLVIQVNTVININNISTSFVLMYKCDDVFVVKLFPVAVSSRVCLTLPVVSHKNDKHLKESG